MAGSDVVFDDRGLHELKGVPGQWRLYLVTSEVRPLAEEEPVLVPVEQERRRRPWTRIAVAGLAAMAAAAAAILLTRGDGQEAFSAAPNSVIRIDPRTGRMLRGTPLGSTPVSVAFGAGSVWVVSLGGPTIQRIDPNTNQAHPVPTRGIVSPHDIAVGAGYVWVASSSNRTLSRLEPSTGEVKAIDVGLGVTDVALSDPNLRLVGAFVRQSIWLTNSLEGSVLRVDPKTGRVDRIDLPGASRPGGIAVGAGSAWVADTSTSGSRVFEIDISTNDVVGKAIRIRGGHPEQVALSEGYVWVTNPLGDSVTRIDPETNENRTIRGVGKGPIGVATGARGVWVASGLDRTVAQIDPETGRVVRRIKTGFSPTGVAVGGGSVWVTLRSA
jgi:streptogramin lyase